MSRGRIIQRGSEAVLYLDGEDTLVKERVKKGYRIPQLDETIRKQRTKREVRLLDRARRAGVPVPAATVADTYLIRMDYVNGRRLKDVLNGMGRKEQDRMAEKIGGIAAALHSSNIIHGDITTSNMILKGDVLHIIDFGLGKVSDKVEDKATDLFLLREALLSAHFEISERIWKNIINIYVQQYSKAREVLARFERIERRRRYK